MPLLAGASPVAIAAVAAGVMLGKTETASHTASPLSAMAPRCGASPSRMAARSTSGLMPSSTRSRAGLGEWLPVSIRSSLFYPFVRLRERTTDAHPGAVRPLHPGQDGEGVQPLRHHPASRPARTPARRLSFGLRFTALGIRV